MKEVLNNTVERQSYWYRPFRDNTGVSILVGDTVLYYSKKYGDTVAQVLSLSIKITQAKGPTDSVVVTRNIKIKNLKIGRIYNISNSKNIRLLLEQRGKTATKELVDYHDNIKLNHNEGC